MTIRKVLGNIIIGLSILFGLYLGVWCMFAGGIIEIIEAIKSTPIKSLEIAVGILKIIFASGIGIVTGLIGIVLGLFIRGIEEWV